ncbi:BRD4-interacting chromatin-remodeling complex-associated protein-like [Antennarius striatus]|uniref:BRD4-interacting chromatin-remodeling complex-associated protein-like n=1 Tax=Antennarius striatus TaxID=241820 RepID=UPI0035B05954
MDDEDDRHLLDILGDVDALNDYFHGSNSKSIEEDDVTNAAYGSDGSFFAGDATGSNSGLKDGSSSVGEFGEDSAGAGLQLSSSLSFIEDELGPEASPGDVDLGGEDQPFDILQKSLMEADITEQTLAQEALLDAQPAPTLVQAPVPFTSQLVSGGYGGGVGVVTTATAAFPAGQFLQGVSQLPNGSAQHIQVLGSFGAGGGVMTLSSLERSPQIVLRPGAPVAAAGAPAGGQVFAPMQGQVGQVGLPFKNIPLQNIIIQRGTGAQTPVRPIQPKPLQSGPQTVYSLGLQSSSNSMANVVNANAATPGGQYAANGSIMVQPPLEQQQAQPQNSAPAGQFLLPGSFALTPSNALHNGPADPASNALIANQNAVQIVSGQNFTAPAGGQLILNQGVVGGGQVGGAAAQSWTGVSCASSANAQTSCAAGRLTLVGPAVGGIGGQGQVTGSPVQRLLVTQTQNCTSLSPLPGTGTEHHDYRQSSSPPALKQDKQVQLSNIHDSTANAQVAAQKRPVLPPLTRGGMVLQQLRNDHAGVQTPNRRQFISIEDALQRLLPYHVFQGAPPNQEEFSQVDEEFEVVASQVLKRTHAMVNKYRRLLMVEAERSSPSSEMVMIDRTFNQEERSNLTQDKRMVLVDPDSFLEDFCCGRKSKLFQDPLPSQSQSSPSCSWKQSDRSSTEPPYRTDSQPGYGDPGGGKTAGDKLQPPLLESKSVLELKRSQQPYGPSSTSTNSLTAAKNYPQGNASPFAAGGQRPPHPVEPQYPPPLASTPHPDTDSALEAAVNSILEC